MFRKNNVENAKKWLENVIRCEKGEVVCSNVTRITEKVYEGNVSYRPYSKAINLGPVVTEKWEIVWNERLETPVGAEN